MNIKLVTGNTLETSVEASDDRALYAGIVGKGDYVFRVGQRFAHQIIGYGTVRIYDGEGIMQGAHFIIPYGKYDDIEIDSCVEGYKRIDLICARYFKYQNAETVELVVVKGLESAKTPEVPSVTVGSILEDTPEHNMPLKKVTIQGSAIIGIEDVFEEIPTIFDAVAEGNNLANQSLVFRRKLTSADDCDNVTDNGIYYYGTGDVPKNAPYPNASILAVLGSESTTTQKIQIGIRYGETGYMSLRPLTNNAWFDWRETAMLNDDGVLPVAKGGTGASNASEARTKLGVPPISHAASAATYGSGDGSNYGHVKLSDATNSTSGASGGIAATPKAVKEAYDKAKQALGEDDGSAWKRLPLEKGIASGVFGREYPVYRKRGPEVSIEGTVAYTASASTVTLATLPAGYRPKSPVMYGQNNCSGKRIARIHVLTSGLLEVEWVCNISDGSTVTEKLDWLDISIKYCID